MVELNYPVPDSFLDEEERNGYFVSRQRKELWAIEIDLLMKIDQVCRQHGLHYCAAAGTMLGAVRHHGFIPWDDDIDIFMVRHDYDRLMELTGEFEAPYFLQNIHTEKNRIHWHARLRNSQTTAATAKERYSDVCKGVFLDIFPLDGVSADSQADARQKRQNDWFKKKCKYYNTVKSHRPLKNTSKRIKRVLLKGLAPIWLSNPEKLQKDYDNNLKKYSSETASSWGNRTLFFDCNRTNRPLKDYTDVIMMPFEFIEIPVPRNYDSILHQRYGDYMQIPENKKGGLHGDLIVSTDYAFDDPRRTKDNTI